MQQMRDSSNWRHCVSREPKYTTSPATSQIRCKPGKCLPTSMHRKAVSQGSYTAQPCYKGMCRPSPATTKPMHGRSSSPNCRVQKTSPASVRTTSQTLSSSCHPSPVYWEAWALPATPPQMPSWTPLPRPKVKHLPPAGSASAGMPGTSRGWKPPKQAKRLPLPP